MLKFDKIGLRNGSLMFAQTIMRLNDEDYPASQRTELKTVKD